MSCSLTRLLVVTLVIVPRRSLEEMPRRSASLSAISGPETDAFDRLTDLDTALDAFQEIGGASLRAEWTLGPGRLTSVSAKPSKQDQ